MKQHRLQCLKTYFEAVLSGDKLFEIRDNRDRGFQKGDSVMLWEYDPDLWNESDKEYGMPTGRHLILDITYVTNFEQKPGFVVFGFGVRHG
ncbi:DUF3850 domain-containing protein [Methylomonas sp. SURF-1]|uniref:DUF3850 domain-containing protein n=1 Tax=Methylomonas aurea TaxID=2952224 RepID=A0ABT1UIY5_9GAMM|nr:DUF3850 domain-containing protein [Methylomonas sp. SURF-1]MCQ8182205.1 DUF3850 domain-containing protein [Methylomonas sp. SURF-1]